LSRGPSKPVGEHDNKKTNKNPLAYLLAYYRGGQVIACQWVLFVYMKKIKSNKVQNQAKTEFIEVRGKTAMMLQEFAKQTGRDPSEVMLTACEQAMAKHALLEKIETACEVTGLSHQTINDWFLSDCLNFKEVVTFDDNVNLKHPEQLLMNDCGQLVVKDKEGFGRTISLRDSLFWIGQRVVSEKGYSWPYESMAKYFKMVAGAFGEEVK
jgi:hypothetical protein